MKKIIITLVFFLLLLNNKDSFGSIFNVNADLNSISPILFEETSLPYIAEPLNTGIFISEGDLLEMSASGIWSNAPISYNLIFGPDGNPNENIVAGYPGAGYPVAALMGKIGDGDYFFVGSSYSDTINHKGVLYLGFNDTDYGNNWGDVVVSVTMTSPIPEPGTMLLFGMGVLGFVWKKRRV